MGRPTPSPSLFAGSPPTTAGVRRRWTSSPRTLSGPPEPLLSSVLIANRGEIARRIIRACRALGVRSVAVYSEADRGWPFVAEADEAVAIGPAPARESYLNADRVLGAARQAGVEAIHPGYGFLSENWRFARQCQENGFVFV